MKNRTGEVIYIGKAKNLRKRVVSYFSNNSDIKTRNLVARIDTIEHIITHNEYEALILENNLIKKWQPKYNLLLKDGKSFPVIKITNETYPRIYRTRRTIEDGSDYFGPFPQTGVIDLYLELIEKLYPLRKCKGPLKKREQPCLYYHIKLCSAPCTGHISQEEYSARVDIVKRLLRKKTDELEKDILELMNTEAAALKFEKAAVLRDTLTSIRKYNSLQDVQDFNSENRDYVGWISEEGLCIITVLQMRDGRLAGKRIFRMNYLEKSEDTVLNFFIQYYGDSYDGPSIIYLGGLINFDFLNNFFKENKRGKIRIIVPKRGRHKSLVALAERNARIDGSSALQEKQLHDGLRELQSVCTLKTLPERIEGFDIAHLQGKYTVASMISFYKGLPDKKNYRRYHVRSLNWKIDDIKSIREVVARRYTRVLNDNLPKPDLVLIDGGKGQVNAARKILDALELGEIPVVGLAKKNEEIFMPYTADPLVLPKTSAGLKILQRLRDETHRFATSFNKNLRKSDLNPGSLEDIPGIGPKRSSRLLAAYGSLEAIRNAPVSNISETLKIPLELAETVRERVDEYLKEYRNDS